MKKLATLVPGFVAAAVVAACSGPAPRPATDSTDALAGSTDDPGPASAAVQPTAQVEFGMVVHGGAGGMTPESVSPERQAAIEAGLTAALEAGHAVLAEGGSSLDAVEAAIRVMEDDSVFNAGRGAVFTHDGRNALDASIMDGATLRAGAVAGVEDVRNPITLARLVMTESPHVMLSGRGAEDFARERGIPATDPGYFRTERRWKSLQDALEDEDAGGGGMAAASSEAVDRRIGTVGAVALDRNGALAAATSTGGMTNKRWDRIGDAPIIGAGTYAGERCAISGTGWGEYFIRNAVAYQVCARMEFGGATLAQAADQVIMHVLEAQQDDTGGVIGMDADGHVVLPFNTSGMNRGWIDQDGNVSVAIFRP